MKWDAYIHVDGTLIVKKMWGDVSTIDRSSGFVLKYISPVKAETREEAIVKLSAKAISSMGLRRHR